MTNRLQPEQQIIETISDVTGTPVSHINENTRLADDLGMDSLEILTVISELEKMSKISISDEETATIKTVGDIAQLMIAKLNPVDYE